MSKDRVTDTESESERKEDRMRGYYICACNERVWYI